MNRVKNIMMFPNFDSSFLSLKASIFVHQSIIQQGACNTEDVSLLTHIYLAFAFLIVYSQ